MTVSVREAIANTAQFADRLGALRGFGPGGRSTGMLAPVPSLELDFAADRHITRDRRTLLPGRSGLSNIMTTTRASGGGYFDHLGVYQWAANNTPRIDHDPATLSSSTTSATLAAGAVTLAVTVTYTVGSYVRATHDGSNWMAGRVTASTGTSVTLWVDRVVGSGTYASWTVIRVRGLLVEESRTNLLIRSSVGGVVIGTPGTLPTGWSYAQVPGGCSAYIVGSGSVNGLSYVDIRLSGTTTNTNALLIQFGSAAVAAGQYCLSCYAAVIAGSVLASGFNGGGGVGAFFDNKPLTANLARYNSSWTLKAGTLYPWLHLTPGGVGLAIDVTVRVAAPQLEAGSFPTSYIPTTTAQVTRAADQCVVSNLADWYRASEGALFAGWSLIYPQAGDTNQHVAVVSDGGFQNYAGIRKAADGDIVGRVLVANNTQAAITAGRATASVMRAAMRIKADDFAISLDGAASVTDTSGTIPAVSKLDVGYLSGAGQYLNGHVLSIRYFPRRLLNTELQRITA